MYGRIVFLIISDLRNLRKTGKNHRQQIASCEIFYMQKAKVSIDCDTHRVLSQIHRTTEPQKRMTANVVYAPL